MATLRLISFATCPYVHRTTTMLHEKGVAFDIDYIDLKNKPAWFLELSPRGKVPVLVVDGQVLFESAAINEYLDETHPPRLIAQDPIVRAQHRAFIEVANDLFMAQYKLGGAATKDENDAVRAEVDKVLERFEGALKGPFFGGESFGLVDAAVAPVLLKYTILEMRTGERFLAAFPKVEAWAKLLSARPSVRKGVLPGFEELWLESFIKRAGWFARDRLGATVVTSL